MQEKMGGLGNTLKIVDTFSENQEYNDEYQAHIEYSSGKTVPENSDDLLSLEVSGEGQERTFTIRGLDTTSDVYTLVYQTLIKESEDPYTNRATIYSKDKSVGYVYDDIQSTVDPISKELLTKPTKDNKYRASFGIVVSGKSYNEITEQFDGVYTIIDSHNGNLWIDVDTLKVYLVTGSTETQIYNFGYTYKNNTLTVTIDHAGKNTYKITYDAIVQKTSDDKLPVTYENDAKLIINGEDWDVHFEQSVDVDSSGSADAGGSNRYIRVDKVASNNYTTKLSGATFKLYVLPNGVPQDKENPENLLATGTTGVNGDIYFGLQPQTFVLPEGSTFVQTTYKGEKYNFANSTVYLLEEVTAPNGYKKSEDITFVVSNDATNGPIYVYPAGGVLQIENDELTEYTITKIWNDENDCGYERPESVKMQLNGTYIGEDGNTVTITRERELTNADVVVGNNNQWSYTFKDLPVYAKVGDTYRKITYSVDEVGIKYKGTNAYTSVPTIKTEGEAYWQSNKENSAGETRITNTYNKKSIELEKRWEDGNNRDSSRPESIQIKLTATAGGQSIQIDEQFFNNYAKNVEIYVNKTKIENISSVLNKATGIITLSKPEQGGNIWTLKLDKLPVKVNGMTVAYSLNEIPISGYEMVSTSENGKIIITNYKSPSTLEQTVTKCWEGDYDNFEGNRQPITVQLKVRGINQNADQAIVVNKVFADTYQYTASGGQITKIKVQTGNGTISDISETGQVTMVDDGDGNDTWTCTWKNLPVNVIINGVAQQAVYTVEEVNGPSSYESSINNFVITNTYKENLTNKKVYKVWNDDNNKYQARPQNVGLQLYYMDGETEKAVDETFVNKYNTNRTDDKKIKVSVNGGTPVNATTGSITLTGSENEWTCEWLNLPKVINGSEVVYKVKETTALSKYTSSAPYSGNGATFTGVHNSEPYVAVITNTYEKQKGTLTLTKKWEDSENKYGVRPDSIILKLSYKLGNDTEFTKLNLDFVNAYMTPDTSDAIGIVAENSTHSVISGDPGLIQLTALTDSSNQSSQWECVVSNLPLEVNNQTVTWRMEEVIPDGGIPNYSVTQPTEAMVLSITDIDKNAAAEVTNTYDYPVTDIHITKQWNDDKNAEGSRPASVQVKLTGTVAGEDAFNVAASLGTEEKPIEVKINDGGWATISGNDGVISITKPTADTDNSSETWSCSVKNLPKKWHGKDITYQIQEINVLGGYSPSPVYKTNIPVSENITITNTKDRELTKVRVIKEWQDNADQDGYRPESIQVQLLADGEEYGNPITLSADPNDQNPHVWSYEWGNLPKYKNVGGEKTAISYTVKELETFTNSDKYTVSKPVLTSGSKTDASLERTYKITNSRTTDKISLSGIKIWRDNDQNRPDEILLELWKMNADGIPMTKVEGQDKIVSGKSNIWSCFWTDLEKKEAGVDIIYGIKEKNTDGSDLEGYYSVMNPQDPMILENITTEVEISKQTITGEELAGAVLQIIDPEVDQNANPDANPVVTQWTSGSTPVKLDKNLLKPGKEYILHEESAPDGYCLAEDVVFTVNTDGTVTKVVMRDIPTEIYVSKREIDGSGEIPGATIEIVHKYKDTDTGEEIEEVMKRWTSGYTPETITGLNTDTEYILRETIAPDGYTVASEITFVIQKDGSVVSGEKKVKDNLLILEDSLRPISFAKVDKETNQYVAGAELEIHYAVKNDEDEFEQGSLASTINGTSLEWISGAVPETFYGVKKGTYYLVETKAPIGYKKAEPLLFEVKDEVDADAELQLVTLENETNKVVITKSFWRGTEEPMTPVTCTEPAVFKILDKNGGDAYVVKNGELKILGEFMLYSGNSTITIEGLPDGDYILHEVSAPAGYTRAKDIPFTVSGDAVLGEPIEVKNCPTKVTISKTDIATGEELPGATLQVLYADTEEVAATIYYDKEDESTWDQLLQWESTDEPRVIEGLPAGDYILHEKIAPDGYTVAKDILFTITDDLTVENKIVMEDKITEVSISKRKMLGISELSGAHLQVLDESGKVATTIYYKDDTTTPDEKLDWISGEAAKVFKGLRLGKYKLVEVKSPDGYALSDPIEFEVTADGYKVTEVVMRDDTTKVHISKMDVTNNKDLPGARLALKDSQGNIITEWTSTGKPKVIEGQLIAGETYTLTEIAAPVGYDLAKDITFTVNSDGEIQKVVMEDKVSDGKGSITVQKLVMMDGKYTAIDYTFYVALFADEACTQRVSNVKPLNVSGSYTASTVFTKLQYGTYYVAETDEEGNAISEGEFIEANQVIDGKAVLTPTEATAKSTILNHVKGFDKQYYYDGKITVDKRVLINGVEGNVNDTFYFALFVDPELTTMADAGVKSLRLNGQSRGTVTFSDLPYGEYYLAETDEEGYPVDDDFAYTVTISSYCKIDADTKEVLRTVTNSKSQNSSSSSSSESITSAEGGKYTTGTKPVKTGDNTPFMMYLLIFGASAIVLLGVYGKKRKKKNNM